MNIIFTPRRGGKTFHLIQMMKENHDMIMVCISNEQADELARQFPNIGRHRFVTYWNPHALWGRSAKLLLDDVDQFLQMYFSQQIDTITFDK